MELSGLQFAAVLAAAFVLGSLVTGAAIFGGMQAAVRTRQGNEPWPRLQEFLESYVANKERAAAAAARAGVKPGDKPGDRPDEDVAAPRARPSQRM